MVHVSECFHKPVLVAEVVVGLQPRACARYADGTLGGGGHAEAILAAGAPDAWLFGCDRDSEAVRVATQRLAEYASRVEFRVGSYADLATWLPPGSMDGVLLDLGVNSYQIECGERGFSFQRDGPLDMRFDRTQALTAEQLVNQLDTEELAKLFLELGGEPRARRIARAISRERQLRPLTRTLQLAELIERVAPRRGHSTHPATRVFQALRMIVNDEQETLRRGLAAAWHVLRPGGRLAVIAFHSGEDKFVRQYGRALAREYEFDGEVDVPELRRPRPAQARWVTRKAVRPSEAEAAANPRARSASLRVLEKLGG